MTQELLDRITAVCSPHIRSSTEFRGELTLLVNAPDIVRVCEILKSDPHLGFDLLVDITAVDYYRPTNRFEVVYHLYAIGLKQYLRLKVQVDEEHPVVSTVTGVWPAANWHERETFDMFGIRFEGHPDLRRLYMPEEFEYHPLRKDFPLIGIPDSLPLPRR